MIKVFSYEQILQGVIEEIADSLAIEPEDIKPDDRFFLDLDGESIDLLHASFGLERRFGIREHLSHRLSSWQVDETGAIAAETLATLRADFPGIDWSQRMAGKVARPRDLLTIGLIADIVHHLQPSRTPS